jgi:hypothetical protein
MNMKQKMRYGIGAAMLAIAGSMLTTELARAESVTANYGGIADGRSAGFSDMATRVDELDPDRFWAFSIDMADPIEEHATTTWNIVPLAQAQDSSVGPIVEQGEQNGTEVASALGYMIASGILNDVRFLEPFEAQALELALWEIVRATPDNPFDLGSGTVQFWAVGQIGQISADMLGNLPFAMSIQGLVGLTSGSAQDFVAQVPLPAAAWLFASAIVGAIALGRRGRRVDAAARA